MWCDRCDQPAVDIAGDRDVIRMGLKNTDCLLTIPITLDPQAVLVKLSAPITVIIVIRIVVLNCLPLHITPLVLRVAFI